MDAEAVAGLNRSNITVKKYAPPVGLMWLHLCLVIVVMSIFPRRENFLPGSLVYDNLLVYTPGFARFALQMRPLTLFLMLSLHPGEALYMHMSRLQKHTVPTFSVLWWKWFMSTFVEGYPAFIRFNRIVREEEIKKANAKH